MYGYIYVHMCDGVCISIGYAKLNQLNLTTTIRQDSRIEMINWSTLVCKATNFYYKGVFVVENAYVFVAYSFFVLTNNLIIVVQCQYFTCTCRYFLQALSSRATSLQPFPIG